MSRFLSDVHLSHLLSSVAGSRREVNPPENSNVASSSLLSSSSFSTFYNWLKERKKDINF